MPQFLKIICVIQMFIVILSSSFSFALSFRAQFYICLTFLLGSFLILKKTEHKTIRHRIIQCLTDKYCCALREKGLFI